LFIYLLHAITSSLIPYIDWANFLGEIITPILLQGLVRKRVSRSDLHEQLTTSGTLSIWFIENKIQPIPFRSSRT